MKVSFEKKQLVVQFENEHEIEQYEFFKQQARDVLPKLRKLMREEPLILADSEFWKKQQEEGLWVAPSLAAIFEKEEGHLALTTGRKLKATRRDVDGNQIQLDSSRVALAGLKLLCFVPYEQVLEQEKAWRRENYLRELRDQCVTKDVKHAEYRAVRNANTCLERARQQVNEHLKKNPDYLVKWITLYDVATHS